MTDSFEKKIAALTKKVEANKCKCDKEPSKSSTTVKNGSTSVSPTKVVDNKSTSKSVV